MDVKLIPISKDTEEWQCSILKLGGVSILLDCGWTDSLDEKLLAPLVPHLADLDLILLTHADFKHVGALPYLVSRYPVSCPVVCTEPVGRLGELCCVAFLEDRAKYRAPAEEFDVDDVLRVFMSRVTLMNYRETFHVNSRGRLIAACPHPSGGQLGGAYWILQCGGLSIVYLVDGDLRRSRFIGGLDLQRLLPSGTGGAQQWDVLITSPLPAVSSLLPQRGARQAPQEATVTSKAVVVAHNVKEQLILEETIHTLRRGGTVLIPGDVSGSIPELLLLFEAAWTQDRQLAANYPLVWLSSMGDMILDQVKTRLEFMSQDVLARFEIRFGQNPFVLRNITIFQNLEELSAAHALSRPKVIFTTSPHLESGDSRELFMRLASEPRTLLWLVGLPPTGCLARQLLDDFVLRHATRKEYRLFHHSKHALPEEQVRAYYETKVQEMSAAGQKLPPELSGLKAELDFLAPKAKPEDLPMRDSEEGGKVASSMKLEVGVDATGAAAKLNGKHKGAVASFWTPMGWPASRTIAHSEWRNEGDEYGHLLTAAELKAWRAQDQEGNQYSFGGDVSLTTGADDSEPAKVKEEVKQEVTKVEEELPGQGTDALADLRESLQVHFREPMRYEARERNLTVACRVKYVPDKLLERHDLIALVHKVSPKHAVLLPSSDEVTFGSLMARHFACSRALSSTAPVLPKIHTAPTQEPWLQLTLRSLKRKVTFSPGLWPKLSFIKTLDGTRVARVRAEQSGPAGLDQHIVELGKCTDEGGEDAPKTLQPDGSAASLAHARLPREGALFLSLHQEPLSLSGLKEQLRIAEWSRDDVSLQFQTPSRPAQPAATPWSSRALAVNNKAAVLSWSRQPGNNVAEDLPILRLEGVPGEEFFMARAAVYKRCAAI